MITIKIVDIAPLGACSYYRSIGPLSKLRKINSEIKIEYLEGVSWNSLSDCDILFVARPVSHQYIEAIGMAQSLGIKVWIDFDDDLRLLPKDNPSHGYFTSEAILKNIDVAVQSADVVTVSTEQIRLPFSKLNPNVVIVENAFNDYNYSFEKRNNSAKIISWRGSSTHRKDLMSCKEGILSISRSFPEWLWVFFGGGDLWYMLEDSNVNFKTINELEIVRYNKSIYDLQPSIHICPLIESEFNLGKSNIAWIEATWAGAACIAPGIPEFMKSGCINYGTNFKYVLEKSIKSKIFRKEYYEKSFEYIKENLLLSKINNKRIKIIEDLLNPKEKIKNKILPSGIK